jgi:hypothetical protein
MNNPDHGADALLYVLDELGNEFKRLGQVVIDEWFGMDLGEESPIVPRQVGLLGKQPVVFRLDELAVAGSSVVPRSRSNRPWLRAKKGRSRQ